MCFISTQPSESTLPGCLHVNVPQASASQSVPKRTQTLVSCKAAPAPAIYMLMLWVSPGAHLWVLPHAVLSTHTVPALVQGPPSVARACLKSSLFGSPSPVLLLLPGDLSWHNLWLYHSLIQNASVTSHSNLSVWPGGLLWFGSCLLVQTYHLATPPSVSELQWCWTIRHSECATRHGFVLLFTFPTMPSSYCPPGKGRAASVPSPLWSLP